MHPVEKIKLPKYIDNDLDDAHNHGRTKWHKWVTENKQWEELMQGYLASISYVDHQLGRLLDALDALPMKDNTIIVLWSDQDPVREAMRGGEDYALLFSVKPPVPRLLSKHFYEIGRLERKKKLLIRDVAGAPLSPEGFTHRF